MRCWQAHHGCLREAHGRLHVVESELRCNAHVWFTLPHKDQIRFRKAGHRGRAVVKLTGA